LSSTITETKRAILSAKKKAVKARSASEIDFQAIVDADDEIDNLEAGLKKLNALKRELF
jgi:hypothetical protein